MVKRRARGDSEGLGSAGRSRRGRGAGWRPWALGLCAAAAAVGAGGCEDDTAPVVLGSPAPTEPVLPAGAVAWTAETGATTKAPAYGVSCRPWRDTLWQLAGDGASDDLFELEVPRDAGAPTLTLAASQGGDAVLEATLTLEAVQPKDKVWVNATGTVRFGPGLAYEGAVIDGAVCAESRVTAGSDVRLEFALIVDGADGTPWSLGGDVEVPGSVVTEDTALRVTADPAALDLQ